ncbi:sce7726 family protein [Dehalobacter restrictus]|uniref:sce7726 family protein n=1 Tax=Dehalobacter restrictus TaxID=55583 RepID=UPI0030144A9B
MGSNNLILNRLFTRQVINNLVKHNCHDVYAAVIEKYIANMDNYSNREIFRDIYKYMSENYRNEYFYQNTLLNKLLLGRHSLKTTTALSQVPIERSKADFILINGKAVAYEIKTELDTFDRLQTQISDYYKAFNHVCVVTCQDNYAKLSDMLKDTTVGICVLSKSNTLQFKKEATENNEYLNHSTFFKILRKYEFENVLLESVGSLPEATPVFYYDECYKLFKTIPLEQVYKLFLIELKKRNTILDRSYFKNVPYELKSVIYFSDYFEMNYEKLVAFLNKSYREATGCISHM